MFDEYLQNINSIINKIDKDVIKKAGEEIANCYINGGMLYLFGTGHSHMLALEMFYRAGGLVKVNPILYEDLMLHKSASASTLTERREGLAESIISQYSIKANDVIIIFSNSGRNAVPVEMAEICKAKGIFVLALTNLNQSTALSSRARSGKKLYEIADIVIDNHGQAGDACVKYDNQFIAPTSTAIGAIVVNLLLVSIVKAMQAKGHKAEIFASSNVDGGDEINNAFIEKYKKIIKNL